MRALSFASVAGLALSVAVLGAAALGCEGNGGLVTATSVGTTDGGANPGPEGPSVDGLANGGNVTKSPHYKAVFTFGQSSLGQNQSKSSGNRANGGLVGAMNGPGAAP